MASIVSAGTTTATALNMSADTSGVLQLASNNGTVAVTVDASGNLGVGTTSPIGRLEAVGGTGAGFNGWFRTGDATAANNAGGGFYNTSSATAANRSASMALDADGANLSGGDYFIIQKNGNSGTADILQYSNASIRFGTNFTNRAAYDMTLDSSGILMLGTTTSAASDSNSLLFAPSTKQMAVQHATGTTSGTNYINFLYAAANVGSITQNGTTAVSYNTTSDYRLKENVQPLSNALAKVAALKPCTYTWKSAPDEIGEGFIAHELQEVCPQAVTGEKDALDEDGKPKYQSIDVSFLVATLTAAIQEQQALITQLQADVAALKGAQA